MSLDRYVFLRRAVNKCGTDKVLEAILMLEGGASKSAISKHLGVHPSYTSQILKELGPPVIAYRVPAELLGVSDDGFTDDLGAVRAHRPGCSASQFSEAYGFDPVDARDVVNHTSEMDSVEFQQFMLNTVERASAYAAHTEGLKFDGI